MTTTTRPRWLPEELLLEDDEEPRLLGAFFAGAAAGFGTGAMGAAGGATALLGAAMTGTICLQYSPEIYHMLQAWQK